LREPVEIGDSAHLADRLIFIISRGSGFTVLIRNGANAVVAASRFSSSRILYRFGWRCSGSIISAGVVAAVLDTRGVIVRGFRDTGFVLKSGVIVSGLSCACTCGKHER
jgi:hypothetical protein